LKKLIIITGANKGLGKALFDEFLDLKEEIVLVSISRNLSDLQKKLLSEKNEKFIFISVDLDNMHNTSELTVLDAYVKIIDKVIFISNAGNIDPIGQIGQIDEQELVIIPKSVNAEINDVVFKYAPW
jgi:benzil reductase ((S)-benzoin forming)